ncbi:nucleotidyltransferase domain-containing protein [Selenomonas sp. AB3002]|uniref:nucleotidyltransferase family protein n=1 Tax=Selenomonas sp. AB3002 TaxID=1392502 RepID=UPI000495AF08
MNKRILSLEDIVTLVRPLAERYNAKELYLFGSYARGEADENSDLDFLVIGGDKFKLTNVFALGEELREASQKNVDIFEIHEINQDSELYKTIMQDRILIV